MDSVGNFDDMPEQLQGPSRIHGREMVALVYGAGMASEAMKVLGELASRSRNQAVLHAIRVLSGVFNETSTAYCRAKGWSEEGLAMCDRDIQLSFAGSVVKGSGSRIILDS